MVIGLKNNPTVAKWIGHRAWRLCVSRRWPPDLASGVAFGEFLQHIDGTEVFYVRGVAKVESGEGQLPDAVAREVFGDACGGCVKAFAYGTVITSHIAKPLDIDLIWDTEFACRWSTTCRAPKVNIMTKLCISCRKRMAEKAIEACLKECERLKVEVTVTMNEELQMTTAQIINRLFECYPLAKLEFVSDRVLDATIGFRFYRIRSINDGGVLVLEENRESSRLMEDQRHAIHLRDVLLGKKRNEAGELV